MKTFLNFPVFPQTLAILYLCDYDYEEPSIRVVNEIQFTSLFGALEAYANIPNPESQMASGKNKVAFEEDLNKLHAKLNDPEWVKELAEYL